MKVVTVGSGKGGTGKSVLAANLGLAFAQRGLSTCVVDLDLGSADLHLLLGQLDSRRGVLDVLRGEARALADVMAPTSRHPRLHLVPGAGETLRAAALTARDVAQIAAGLRELPVDVVVADLPGGVAHQVLELFASGDAQVVVTTADPVAIADAGQLLRLARVRRAAHGGGDTARRPRVYTSIEDLARDMNALRGDAPAGRAAALRPFVVFNRCRGAQERPREDLLARLRSCAGEGVDFSDCAEVPEDAAVEQSTRLLRPLLEIAPGSPAGRAITELAARLAPPADAPPPRAALPNEAPALR